jgi:hypothetical protein
VYGASPFNTDNGSRVYTAPPVSAMSSESHYTAAPAVEVAANLLATANCLKCDDG